MVDWCLALVVSHSQLAEWFKGTELAFAFGINLSISKLGSAINNIVSPVVADQVSIAFALWLGVILCGFGVTCVLITMPIDRNMNEHIASYLPLASPDNGHREDLVVKPSSSISSEDNQRDVTENNPIRDVSRMDHVFWLLVILCVHLWMRAAIQLHLLLIAP